MKLNKSTYFSFFFLFCFLGSFSVNTYQGLNTKFSKKEILKKNGTTLSKKECNQDSKVDFLLEENENETEGDFEIQAFSLPFFITYYQFQIVIEKPLSAQPLAEKLTNPIYIAVCNFRI